MAAFADTSIPVDPIEQALLLKGFFQYIDSFKDPNFAGFNTEMKENWMGKERVHQIPISRKAALKLIEFYTRDRTKTYLSENYTKNPEQFIKRLKTDFKFNKMLRDLTEPSQTSPILTKEAFTGLKEALDEYGEKMKVEAVDNVMAKHEKSIEYHAMRTGIHSGGHSPEPSLNTMVHANVTYQANPETGGDTTQAHQTLPQVIHTHFTPEQTQDITSTATDVALHVKLAAQAAEHDLAQKTINTVNAIPAFKDGSSRSNRTNASGAPVGISGNPRPYRPWNTTSKANSPSNLARSFAQDQLKKMAINTAKKWVLANPVVAVILLLFIILVFGINIATTVDQQIIYLEQLGQSTDAQGNNITLQKTADKTTANPGEEIKYQISVTFTGAGTASATIKDTIPEGAEFKESSNNVKRENNTLFWELLDLKPNQPQVVNFTVTATKNDQWLINNAEASVKYHLPILAGSGNLLPNPLPPESPRWRERVASVYNTVMGNPQNLQIYQEASAITGVPWEVLAALHFREGSNNPGLSLVSGRRIGIDAEPDLARAKVGCSSSVTGPGIPVPIAGGCGFATLLDSAIYAGKRFPTYSNTGKVTTYEEAVYAFSGYNGWGNTNCGRQLPYPNCPPPIPGDDHVYTMNMFDLAHDTMYKIYCEDLVKCNPPRLFDGMGAMAVLRAIATGGAN